MPGSAAERVESGGADRGRRGAHRRPSRRGGPRPPDAAHLRGVTLPGLANAHSHAFQRALRGRTHRAGGSFWTWREDMYALAERLDPRLVPRARPRDLRRDGAGRHHLRRRVPLPPPRRRRRPLRRAERVRRGADRGGGRGRHPHHAARRLLPGRRLRRAARGPPAALRRRRRRRLGGARRARWRRPRHALVGAAIHSVRAVPEDQLDTVVAWAREREAPLHFHLSEQRAENEACLAAYGRTPARLLDDHGALGPRSCAVHATHLSEDDVALLGGSATAICMCPTTERDLADGIGPAAALGGAGVAARAGQRQQRAGRHVRGGARGRARRAPGLRAARALAGRGAAAPRRARTGTPRSAGPTPAGSSPARARTS